MNIENIEVIGIAYNGEEEIEMIQKLNPDLVITDNKMPKIDGIDVIEMIIKSDIQNKPEFILVTGDYSFELGKRCNELGVFRVIEKLSGADRLLYALEEFIDYKYFSGKENENNSIIVPENSVGKKGLLEKILKFLKGERKI